MGANPKIETLRKIADALGVDVMKFVQEQKMDNQALKTNKDRCNENKNNITSVSFSTDEYTPDEMKQILKFARFLKTIVIMMLVPQKQTKKRMTPN